MKTCAACGKTIKLIHSRKFNKLLCSKCYQRLNYYDDSFYAPPPHGVVAYSIKGNPICHICGMAYKKLMTHVYQVHSMPEKEYKKNFGLDSTKGILCDETKDKLRRAVCKNYIIVKYNLSLGIKTRFTGGNSGRTKDKVSKQTYTRLVRQFMKHN